jgi:hypothetical protein
VAISLLAYAMVLCTEDAMRNSLKCGISVLSLGQAVLTVFYWSKQRKWLESLRQELNLSDLPIASLLHSKLDLAGCLLECCLLLCVPPPFFTFTWKVEMLGTYCFLTLEDLLCVLILMRNFHLFRYIYWRTALTARKAYMYGHIIGIRVASMEFGVRYGLAAHPYSLVIGLYVVLMCITGVSIYLFEANRPNSDFYTVSNGIWIVAHTQATIGYGEFTPKTYFGCLILIVSCLCGNLTLSLIVAFSSRSLSLSQAESSLYTAVAYHQYQCIYRKEAAVLIQRWWRLMDMRMRRALSAAVVVNYYWKLGKYRGVLQAGEQTKDSRFEGQIKAFHVHVAKECRNMTEYLQPILHAESLVRTN